MALVDMKQSKKKAAESCNPCIEKDAPRYPYGLSVSLENESLKKLGIKTLPKVGETIALRAVAVVESASEHSRQSGTSRRVELQLQKLEVTPTKKPSAEDAVSEAIKDV